MKRLNPITLIFELRLDGLTSQPYILGRERGTTVGKLYGELLERRTYSRKQFRVRFRHRKLQVAYCNPIIPVEGHG